MALIVVLHSLTCAAVTRTVRPDIDVISGLLMTATASWRSHHLPLSSGAIRNAKSANQPLKAINFRAIKILIPFT